MKRFFSKDKWALYVFVGLGIVALEWIAEPPDVFYYFLTPLALICMGIGLFLYFFMG